MRFRLGAGARNVCVDLQGLLDGASNQDRPVHVVIFAGFEAHRNRPVYQVE